MGFSITLNNSKSLPMTAVLRNTFFTLLILSTLGLTSCDKVWTLSQKLKATDEPEVQVVSNGNKKPKAVPVPILDELDDPYGSAAPQIAAKIAEEEAEATEPLPEEPKVNRDAEVSILGYHDFTEGGSSNDMILNIDRFREQMEALKQNKIPVIPISDYLAWRKGEKDIPNPCVVLTFDDGWKSVYTHAYPIMKEYGYPFSIYLYKNYINIGGRSMTWEQIQEMMKHGCEVGSHSVSHSDMARRNGKSDEEYEKWLREELGESMRYLRENLGDDVIPVFAYPYGKYNQQVIDLAQDYGYELGITVAPKKGAFTLEDFEVGRYIVHQTNNTNFGYALSFKGADSLAGANSLTSVPEEGDEEGGEPLVTTQPKTNATITDRRPLISVDISKLEDVVESSITMEVSGFGDVPFDYDPANGLITYQLQEKLRSEQCHVRVSLKRLGESKTDQISWSFSIDRKSLYLADPSQEEQPILSTSAAAPLDPSI